MQQLHITSRVVLSLFSLFVLVCEVFVRDLIWSRFCCWLFVGCCFTFTVCVCVCMCMCWVLCVCVCVLSAKYQLWSHCWFISSQDVTVTFDTVCVCVCVCVFTILLDVWCCIASNHFSGLQGLCVYVWVCVCVCVCIAGCLPNAILLKLVSRCQHRQDILPWKLCIYLANNYWLT